MPATPVANNKASTKPTPTSRKRYKRHTWHLVQTAYIQGVTAAELEKRFGIPSSTIYQYASRHGWPKLRNDTAQLAQDTVQNTLATQSSSRLTAEVDRWVARYKRIVERHLEHLERIDPGELPLKELERLASILDLTDKGGRRALGLDKPEQAPSTLIQIIHAGDVKPSDTDGPTIDVEPVDDTQQ